MFFLLKALVLGAPSSLILRRCTKAPSLRTLRRCFCASIFSPQSLRCVRCVSSFCAFLFHHVLSVIDLKLLKPFSKHIEQNDNDMITKWSLECWLFQVFSHQRKPFRRNSLVRCRIFIVKSLKASSCNMKTCHMKIAENPEFEMRILSRFHLKKHASTSS